MLPERVRIAEVATVGQSLVAAVAHYYLKSSAYQETYLALFIPGIEWLNGKNV